MNRPLPALFLALTTALASSAAAQTSQYTVVVGGDFAVGCQNSTVPPTLDDGVTVGTAQLEFRYDSSTAVLQIEVRNDSPVLPGTPNPVITDLGFCVPEGAVNDVEMVAQSAAGGAPMNFSCSFVGDVTAQPNPNKLACLGNFHVVLEAAQGGIANPAAGIWSVPQKSLVMGPATFDFQLGGPGTSLLTARTIALTNSQIAPRASTDVAVKFQSGGVAGASGFISAERGACLGNLWVSAPAEIGATIELCVGSLAGCHGCLLASLNPGPTVFGSLILPIGLPVPLTVVFPSFPEAPVCAPVSIPDDPSIVGAKIYMTVATPGSPVTFSPQFVLEITQ